MGKQSQHDKYVAERMADPGHRYLSVMPLTLILLAFVVGAMGALPVAAILFVLGVVLLAQAGGMVRGEAEIAVNAYERNEPELSRQAKTAGLSCFSLLIGLLLIAAAFVAILGIVSGY